jgi:hypothetical protein
VGYRGNAYNIEESDVLPVTALLGEYTFFIPNCDPIRHRQTANYAIENGR